MIMRADLDAPTPGLVIGPWRLLERAGSGANGIVYRACLDEDPGRGHYAFKLAREPGAPRFEREAELLSRIDHPHVPRLVDRGMWTSSWGTGYPYLVMQWVEGSPLYRWAGRYGLTSRQALLVLAQVARALEATHQHGVHRDVKGDNVLVSPEGHAVLLDYGCCRYEGARPLTTSALPPGTGPYRSPECLRFQFRLGRNPEAQYDSTHADDMYALGVTAYCLVTGLYPSREVDPEFLDQPERSRVLRLLAPRELTTVTPELEAIILRMLSDKREKRGTPGELAEAMSQAARNAGPEADLRIQPTRSGPPVAKGPDAGKPRWYGMRRKPSWRIPVMLFAAMALLGLLSSHALNYEEWIHRADAPDAQQVGVSKRTVGLADDEVEALVSDAEVARLGASASALALPMLKNPLPGQRKPPCEPRTQKAINGACWWVLDPSAKPPCGKSAYDHDDGCYGPVFEGTRPPTSEQP